MFCALLAFLALLTGWYARDLTRYLFRPTHRRAPTPPRHVRPARGLPRQRDGHPVPTHEGDDLTPDVVAALDRLDPCRSNP